MNLETFFRPVDINEIYDYITMYSILKYRQSLSRIQERFKDSYQCSLQNLEERKINSTELNNHTIESLRKRLNTYQQAYETNILLNKNIIQTVSEKIESMITKTLQNKDELTKITFLFDFITNYINYAEDCYKYCLNIHLADSFIFDFQNNVPVDSSIQGLLVMHQGVCDDISNLIQYLGRKLHLNVSKVNCEHNNTLHSLNSITLKNGKTYLIDATRVIRGDMSKEECFLVSIETLNKNNNYLFEPTLNIKEDYSDDIPDFTEEATYLITKINELIPEPKDINYKNNTRKK